MGIKLLKLKWHIAAILRVILYKILYGHHFLIGGVQPLDDPLVYTLKEMLSFKLGETAFSTIIAVSTP